MTGERVLVVDDHPPAIRVLMRALRRKGFAVDTACDGIEALEKLARESYDVLITDIDMPRMSGRDLCDALHARAGDAPPLTFIVTGGTDPELRDWAAALDGTRFIEKPLSLQHLTEALSRHFEGGAAV